jgi:hypothetical protein
MTELLRERASIPPRVVKAQGDHIAILVARDLDFRGVARAAMGDLRSHGGGVRFVRIDAPALTEQLEGRTRQVFAEACGAERHARFCQRLERLYGALELARWNSRVGSRPTSMPFGGTSRPTERNSGDVEDARSTCAAHQPNARPRVSEAGAGPGDRLWL